MHDLHSQLLFGAEDMGITLSDAQARQMLAYLQLLIQWNKTYNLTAIRNAEDMVTLHLLDSLSVLPYLTETFIADVGSGAGLPGIPLAIMRPEFSFTLVDSNGKKVRFMKHVVRQLHLNNVCVEQQRVEHWFPNKEPFDLILSRAFSSLYEMIHVTEHLLSSNGKWLAMKGTYPETEIKRLLEKKPIIAVNEIKELSIAQYDGHRHLVSLQKTS